MALLEFKRRKNSLSRHPVPVKSPVVRAQTLLAIAGERMMQVGLFRALA